MGPTDQTVTVARALEVLEAANASFTAPLAAWVCSRAAGALAGLPAPVDGSLAQASNLVLHPDGSVTLVTTRPSDPPDGRAASAVLAAVLGRMVKKDTSTPELSGI